MEPRTYTTEEQILRQWQYIQKLFTAYESIKLHTDRLNHGLISNFANDPMISRLTNAFKARQQRTMDIAMLTGLDMASVKNFFESELLSTGSYVRNLLSTLPKD